MLFNSYLFIVIYLPLVLSGFLLFIHYQMPRATRTWLLFCSLWFYAYWDIRFLPLLLGSISFNYLCGTQIIQAINQSSKQKLYLLVGISSNLALLFYFKYYHFFISVVSGQSFSLAEIILPLGISFFTFTQIAYLVDAYQGKAESCDFISYGLFVTIFPHLIAGPILHHKEMLQQFHSPQMYRIHWPHLAQGFFLFVLGLSKKVLIADNLVPYVQPIFDGSTGAIPLIQAWFGALTYTLQLYFDFSGYSDMAIGLGLLFNLHLPINFNSPYQTDSIIDFWHRWHMTLSSFLRQYLYFSLGGNRQGTVNKFRNLLLTMLLGGLWHGAGWTFVIWGAFHGILLVINHLWRSLGFSMTSYFSKPLTFLAVIVGWVIFRSPDLTQAQNILAGMIGWHGVSLPESYQHSFAFLKNYGVLFQELAYSKFHLIDILGVTIVGAIAYWAPNSQLWLERFKQRPLAWVIPCAALGLITFFQLDELSEFLYFQF